MVTIKQIASEANVSITTVSRVLNYDETLVVHPSTREKIFNIAAELDYKPRKRNAYRKRLKIGLINSNGINEELDDQYFLIVRKGIEKKIQEDGNKLLNIYEYDEIEKTDGIICLGIFSKKELKRIISYNKPAICVDSSQTIRGFDSIVHSLRDSMFEEISYLLERGHYKISYIGGKDIDKDGNFITDTRTYAYYDFMSVKNLLRNEYMKVGKFDVETGYQFTKELLQLDDRPTAIIAANDNIAIGAYKAVQEAKLNIPNDISIIGFNDIPSSKYLKPSLTTTKFYLDVFSEKTVDMIVDKIRNRRDNDIQLIIKSKLIERNSVKRIGKAIKIEKTDILQ